MAISEVLKAQKDVAIDDEALNRDDETSAKTVEQQFKDKWESGLGMIRSAAYLYCRKSPGVDQKAAIRTMTFECKQAAHRGQWKIETIMRDHADPLDVATRFEAAATRLRNRLRGKAA